MLQIKLLQNKLPQFKCPIYQLAEILLICLFVKNLDYKKGNFTALAFAFINQILQYALIR